MQPPAIDWATLEVDSWGERPAQSTSSIPTLAGRYEQYLPFGSLTDKDLRYVDLSAFGWFTPVDVYAPTSANVSENAGSIFEATTAIAVDAAITESYPWGTPIESGDVILMVEAFTPLDPSFQYYAVRTRNPDLRVSTVGETVMGRMARTIPPALVMSAQAIAGQDVLTAQQAIQYVFDQWTLTYDWFAAEPVPDLRFLVDGAIHNERDFYIYNPDVGVVTTASIVIPQEIKDGRDDRKTMREILDEWLGLFSGTIVRANSAGRVELIPRAGPDLRVSDIALEWADIKSITDGENDPRGIVNQVTVVDQGWGFAENQTLMPPVFVLGIREDGMTREALESEFPEVAEEIQPNSPYQFSLFVDTGEDITLSVEFRAYSAGNQAGAGLGPEGFVARDITLADGESRTEHFTWPFSGSSITTRVAFSRRGNAVTVGQPNGQYIGESFFAGTRYLGFIVDIVDAVGTGWTRTNRRVSTTFGYDATDVLPGANGENALSESIARFGERSATITSTIFQLTPEQAGQVARGYVLANINPRTIRDVEQTLWRRYPVRFDDIGSIIELPSGERAVVEARDYAYHSTVSQFASRSFFSAAVTHTVLDGDTDWLLFNNGTIFQLDDDTLAKES